MTPSIRRPQVLSEASPSEQRLIELMTRVGFGRIECRVRSGEPVLDTAPLVVREVKLGGERLIGAGCRQPDYALKDAVLELLAELKACPDNADVTIEVRHGLPHRLLVQEVLRG
ncbi:MAG: hypothetical protein J0L78_06175 [Planctomycetes bacterium]|nr:hypothetical protein [Planctomycetota bacterium]